VLPTPPSMMAFVAAPAAAPTGLRPAPAARGGRGAKPVMDVNPRPRRSKRRVKSSRKRASEAA